MSKESVLALHAEFIAALESQLNSDITTKNASKYILLLDTSNLKEKITQCYDEKDK